ncbi:hypothetical protein GCM10022234_25480 [Aeromicrobium panaciterrae]
MKFATLSSQDVLDVRRYDRLRHATYESVGLKGLEGLPRKISSRHPDCRDHVSLTNVTRR